MTAMDSESPTGRYRSGCARPRLADAGPQCLAPYDRLMDAIREDLGDGRRRLISQVLRDLKSDPRIEGAWLVGSLARRLGDRYSDVDLLVAVAEGALAGLVEEWPGRAASFLDLAFARPAFSAPGATTFTHVTSDYLRFDLTFAVTDQALKRARDGISILATSPVHSDPVESDDRPRPAAGRVQKLAEEFLRVLGLLPVVIGRHEYLVAASGAALLRSMLMDLFRELAPAGYRGGAMRLEKTLSADQLEILRGLPPLLWTRDATIELHLACARRFLPAARQAYQDLGMAWPQAFEDAVRTHLRRELDLAVG